MKSLQILLCRLQSSAFLPQWQLSGALLHLTVVGWPEPPHWVGLGGLIKYQDPQMVTCLSTSLAWHRSNYVITASNWYYGIVAWKETKWETIAMFWYRFNQYSGWPMMPGRMMSQRGGPRGRMPPHAGRGGYYSGMLMINRLPLMLSLFAFIYQICLKLFV